MIIQVGSEIKARKEDERFQKVASNHDHPSGRRIKDSKNWPQLMIIQVGSKIKARKEDKGFQKVASTHDHPGGV